jgi:hypothetical protein
MRMRASPVFSLVLFLVVVLGCAGVLLAQPRAARPSELPSLVLPAQPVVEQLAQDRRDAAQLKMTPIAQQLDGLLLELGRADQEGGHMASERVARTRKMSGLFGELVAEGGEAAAIALRAQATQRVMDALDAKLTPRMARDVIGGFSLMLEREGCSRGAEIVAPEFVLRTLYKARWSRMHGRACRAG